MNRLLFVVLLCASTAAQAQFAGTVTGTVTTIDGRADPYFAVGFSVGVNGARQTGFGGNAGGQVPLAEALVHLTVSPSFGLPTEFWTRTNAAGGYTVPWTMGSRPAALRIEVRPTRPNIGTGTVIGAQPAFQFRVRSLTASDIVLGSTTFPPLAGSGGTQIANFALGSSEPGNVFRTARETYAMLDAQTNPPIGPTLRGDMLGVDVFINGDPPVGSRGGMAPDDRQVFLLPSTGTRNPFTVAHELGHILEYRSFDVLGPPAGPLEYGRDQPFVLGAWGDLTNEHEKAAFQEGFAHAVGAMWMWIRAADPPNGAHPAIPGPTGIFDLEQTQPPGDDPDQCEPDVEVFPGIPGSPTVHVNLGHRRAICVARGFWDILDSAPAAAADPIANRDLGEIVRVLRAYPRNCVPFFDNGCVGEGGFDDGMNWSDFRRNYEATFPQSLGGIENSNGLTSSNDD